MLYSVKSMEGKI